MGNNVMTRRAEVWLDNHYQCREALGEFLQLANFVCEGRLASAWLMAERPHGWTPALDGRKAEAKQFKEAEGALLKALVEYDRARLAAKQAEKGAKR